MRRSGRRRERRWWRRRARSRRSRRDLVRRRLAPARTLRRRPRPFRADIVQAASIAAATVAGCVTCRAWPPSPTTISRDLSKPAVKGPGLGCRGDAIVGADEHHDGHVERAVRAREEAQIGRRSLQVLDRVPERAGAQSDGQGRAGVGGRQGPGPAGQAQQLVADGVGRGHEQCRRRPGAPAGACAGRGSGAPPAAGTA